MPNVPSDNSELLYALALMQLDSFWPGIFAKKMLDASQLQNLIACLERHQDYQNEQIHFKVKGKFLYFSIPGECRDFIFSFSIGNIIRQLRQFQSDYQKAKTQNISVEKDLLKMLGDSPKAQQIMLEILARTQIIDSGIVAMCWQILECAIHESLVGIETLEEYVARDKDRWWGIGGDFGMEARYEVEVVVWWLRDECSCPVPDMDKAIEDLVRRFYNAI